MTTVHHLDCCTMCPLGGRFANTAGHLVGHVLALETTGGDVALIDTGISTQAMADPNRVLGRQFTMVFRPERDPARAARRQLEALGRSPADVRHVLVTHLDIDHIGGLSDFPGATAHVHARERAAADAPRTFNERQRYRPALWQDHDDWAIFDATGGDDWFGFAAVRTLPGLGEDVVAIPLAGHTRGHTAFAVRDGDRWWFHTGDAYFHAGSVHADLGPPSLYLRGFEKGVAVNRRAVRQNHLRLTALATGHREVTVFCAHDPAELARARSDP